MTRRDIELLFKNESYDEAMKLLRKELQDDSENAEWFYYLFLAENGDYANINLNDIVCEFDLNRALDFANARLRESFNSEYNFYKAVDPIIRKYFAYASRGNMDKFEQLLDSDGYKSTKLIHDESSTKNFLSNLDYLVTSRIKPEIIDLNLLAINILYLATNNKQILDVYNVLKERAEEVSTLLSKSKLADSLYEIKEYMQALKDNKRVSNDAIEDAKNKPIEETDNSLIDSDKNKTINTNSNSKPSSKGKSALAVANSYFSSLDYESAQKEYEKVLDKDPNNIVALKGKILCLNKKNSFSELFSAQFNNIVEYELLTKYIEYANKSDKEEILSLIASYCKKEINNDNSSILCAYKFICEYNSPLVFELHNFLITNIDSLKDDASISIIDIAIKYLSNDPITLKNKLNIIIKKALEESLFDIANKYFKQYKLISNIDYDYYIFDLCIKYNKSTFYQLLKEFEDEKRINRIDDIINGVSSDVSNGVLKDCSLYTLENLNKKSYSSALYWIRYLLKYDYSFKNEFVNQLFKYCCDNPCSEIFTIFDYLIENNKDACAIYNNYIKQMAMVCHKNKLWGYSDRYYSIICSNNPNDHKAYWELLQSKLRCLDNEELIHQNTLIDTLEEYNNTINAASNSGENIDYYINCLAEQKKWINQSLRKKKFIKIGIISSSIATIAILFFILLLNLWIIPSNKYNNALNLINEGKYNEAREILESMDYSDSKQKIIMLDANNAFASGEYEKGIKCIESISGETNVSYSLDCVTTIKQGYEIKWELVGYSIDFENHSANIRLKSFYTLINYDILYDLNGSDNNSNPTTYNFESDTIVLNDIEKTGYTFLGWTTSDIQVPTKGLTIEHNSIGNKSFTAHFEINSYKITIDNTIEEVSISGITSGLEVDYGRKIHLTAENVPLGNIIMWERNDGVVYIGNRYEFDVPARDITIKTTFAPYSRYENKIIFGTYPQKKIEATEDNGLISFTFDELTWTSYKYYVSSSQSDFMYYKDIDIDNNGTYDYRGVYINRYRPKHCDDKFEIYTKYIDQYQNGYEGAKIYWFSYDPIEWTILKEENGKALIIANLILDSQEYHPNDNGLQFEHNGGNGYANNYELSQIRKFLNETFYNTAFNDLQKSLVETTLVDNTFKSAGYKSSNYSCDNTNDKIFLLSSSEAISYYTSNDARQANGSEYAKCQGLYVAKSDDYVGYSYWWLRSFSEYYRSSAQYVDIDGDLSLRIVNTTEIGVRPVCWINLSKRV